MSELRQPGSEGFVFFFFGAVLLPDGLVPTHRPMHLAPFFPSSPRVGTWQSSSLGQGYTVQTRGAGSAPAAVPGGW